MTASIIAIAGASGSGKSTLARELKERLKSNTNVAVLNEDAYYRKQDQLTREQRERTNYDHPDSIDETLLVEHLVALKSRNAVDVPVYDYQQHDRSDTTLRLGPCEVLIVEGILLLHRQAVRDITDVSVFVDVPVDVCLDRRITRDIAERGRTRESVLAQYAKTVGPMFKQFVAPSMAHADLVVNNSGQNEEAIEKMLLRIRARRVGD